MSEVEFTAKNYFICEPCARSKAFVVPDHVSVVKKGVCAYCDNKTPQILLPLRELKWPYRLKTGE